MCPFWGRPKGTPSFAWRKKRGAFLRPVKHFVLFCFIHTLAAMIAVATPARMKATTWGENPAIKTVWNKSISVCVCICDRLKISITSVGFATRHKLDV